jgi:hypothetical protein
MSIQRKIDPLDATPINAAFTRLDLCDCPQDNAAAHDGFSLVTLRILRFIVAAYVSNEADCWETAFRFADDAVGDDGPQLVAHVVALVRAIHRRRNLLCRPPSCTGLSLDERRIMVLIDAARGNDSFESMSAASAPLDLGHLGEAVTGIAKALAQFAKTAEARVHPAAYASRLLFAKD